MSITVSGDTPIVRWMDVVSMACAEWIHPRGRYSASPSESTVSMTGSSRDALGDGGAVLGPRLRGQRVLVHGFVHDPPLLAGGLQDEHVVDVVMGVEAAVGPAG